MRKQISLLLILAFLSPVVPAQQRVRDNAQGNADETVLRKAQAVDILKGVVEGAAEIQEMRTRMAVLTGALDLLWKHNEVLDAKYTMLAERAKLSDQVLSGLAAVAQRIVTENTMFRFDSGEAAFDAAEKAKDPAERAELLATGIRQQIDDGKYAEAVQKIDDLRDDKISEQLNTYLSFRMAEASLKKLDWYSFNSQVNRVSDARLRTYLILSAALAANDARKKKMSSDFLLTAMAAFPKIEDLDARAAAVITTAGILYSADATWSAQVLTDGVNAINRTNGYIGGVYGVMLEVSKVKVWLPLSKFDLSHCFEQAAKRDWPGALAAAQSIQSKALRSQAYIAACRTVL